MPSPPRIPNTELRAVRHAKEVRNRADEQLRSAIVKAFNSRSGYTVDDIAEAAGLSRPRIYQIVKEANDDAV